MWLAEWQPTPITVYVTLTKIAGHVRVRHYHESVIFFVFLTFIVSNGHFYTPTTFYTQSTHALTLCIHMRCSRAVNACGALRLVGGCTWRHNNVGGVTAGQAAHNSSDVVLSLRDRLDTTIVHIICMGC